MLGVNATPALKLTMRSHPQDAEISSAWRSEERPRLGGCPCMALTVSVPLGTRLHPLQLRGHQQSALESDSLAFSPESDPKLLQKLDVEVHVRNHGRRGHCADEGDMVRAGGAAGSRSADAHFPTTTCIRALERAASGNKCVSPNHTSKPSAPARRY